MVFFEQNPDSHKRNECYKCGVLKTHKKQKEAFLEKMKIKHGGNLDFSNAVYLASNKKVKVKCNKCNFEFEKTPNELDRNGCPNCSKNNRRTTLKRIRYKETLKKIALLLEKSDVKMLDEYNGKADKRGHSWKRYNFKCNKCGYEFKDFFDDQHLQLCPICYPSKNSSKGELEIRKYIIDNYPELKIIPNDRTVLEGKEIDILIPELNIGFEYDGVYWHRDKKAYDKEKDRKAKEKKITIYHIDEKRTKQEKLKNFEKIDKILIRNKKWKIT